MNREDLKLKKYKRILMYYNELSQMIPEARAVEFISEIFAVTEEHLYVILRKYSLEDLSAIELKFFDSELKALDAYAEQVKHEAIVKRGNIDRQIVEMLKQKKTYSEICRVLKTSSTRIVNVKRMYKMLV